MAKDLNLSAAAANAACNAIVDLIDGGLAAPKVPSGTV